MADAPIARPGGAAAWRLRTIARKMSNDVRYTGLWARDLMIKSGWELNAQKKEQLHNSEDATPALKADADATLEQ